jgi:FG-GAP-like repeat
MLLPPNFGSVRKGQLIFSRVQFESNSKEVPAMRTTQSTFANASFRNFAHKVSLFSLFVTVVACCAPATDFVAPRTFAAGEAATAMATADFNGDGKLDVAVVSGSLNIILGNGNGTFQAPVVYSLNSAALAVAVGDFNHDGHPDIAVGTNLGIAIFINTGAGAFNPPVYYNVGATNSIVVGDINGDHYQDLLFGPYSAFETVSSMLGNGDGTFRSPVPIGVPGCPTGLAAGDFNNDGKLDLAVANAINCDNNQGYQISVLKGNGDGSFQTPLNYPTSGLYAMSVAVGDFNKDGNLDLAVVIEGSDTVDVFLGNGDGTLQPGKAFSVDLDPRSLLIADFNGDGNPDIAVAHWSNGDVSVLLGNGLGGFKTASNYQAGFELRAVAAGDFRGVGKPDLLTDDGNLEFLMNQGGTFHAAADYHPLDGANGATIYNLAMGDFNADGSNDIVEGVTGPGANVAVLVSLNNGKGGFKSPIVTKIPALLGSTAYVAVGDFNKDGKLDVAVVERAVDGSESITILLGKGDGTFTTGASYDIAPGYGAAPVAAADFNHDGNLDLIAICGYQVCVLLGNGDGTFGSPVAYNAGGSYRNPPTALAIGDVNHDGKLDVVATILNNVIAVLLGNGDGSFLSPSTYTDKDAPTAVLLADFNRDGNLDIAVADQNNSFGILLGNGDGTFQTEKHYPVSGSGVDSLVAADFNGDGIFDLGLVSSSFPFTFTVVHGKGDGTFKPSLSYSVASSAKTAVVGPFTNSSAPDVAIAGAGLTVYLNVRDF